MNLKTHIFFILISINLTNAFCTTIQVPDSTTFSQKGYVQKGYHLSKLDQEKAYAHFTEGANYYKAKNDTTNYLECMLGLAEIEKRKGKFNRSFDILWGILSVTEANFNKQPLIEWHRKLGVLYGLHGKDSLSLQHLKTGLSISKKIKNNSKSVSPYFAIAEQYINMKEYDSALNYLDSCYLVNPNKNRLIYIDAYYGYIYTKKGNYRKAEIYFNDLIPKFKERKLAFIAMTYTFVADLKISLNQPDSAIYYLKKSLEAIDTMKVHIEIKPEVLEKLAHLYLQKKNRLKAFEFMSAAKAISDSLFHTQSEHNKELFEIRNKYQEDLSRKEEQLTAQSKLLDLKDKASFRLKLLIVILITLAAIGLFTFRQRFLMKKMILNREKNEVIIETRNKELTANALQIIEKEQAVKELLEEIKDSKPEKFKTLSNKYKQGNAKIWDDFHLRFTQTNNKFYEQLMKLYPSLTHTDLKYCALIKLNFDSKEMSHILGISLHSVHMARSRIRKKIGLSRDESLGDYLSSI